MPRLPRSFFRSAGHARSDRVLAQAQRRLAITTLALLVALLAAVGVTTAVLAIGQLDAAVDRSLEAAAQAQLRRLHEATGESPQPSEKPEASGERETDTEGGGSPAPTATARPLPSPTSDADDRIPAAADTFFLILDQNGAILDNPSHVALPSLPDRAAATAALLDGRDLRTTDAGGVRVRLLTVVVPREDDPSTPPQLLQAGFVLTLHDEQQATLVRSILLVGILGLLGAGAIAWVLTRRALAPVRDAVARERRFVAGASHELRTPIALIRSTAEVLTREGASAMDRDRMTRDIVAESDRLAALVGDLSELALAEARPPSAAAPVDLGDLVHDVVGRATPLAHAGGKWLAADEPARPVTVRGDRARLVQVLLILVDNAIQHTPGGGTIRVSAAARADRAELGVSDQGPGIPAAERERVFEPFARLAGGEPHREPGAGGSGLGLAIARSLVTGMRGDIRIEDAPGGGARFVVSLPRG